VYVNSLETQDWYCPDTDETVQTTHRRLLLVYDDQGHRVIRLAEPTLSSDMSFLFGAFVGIAATAALLFVAGYLVLRGKGLLALAVGAVFTGVGFLLPPYYGLSKILLGRKCTKKKPQESSALPPLPYRLGWVIAAEGAGLLTGAAVVIAVALFLISSGTVSYLY